MSALARRAAELARKGDSPTLDLKVAESGAQDRVHGLLDQPDSDFTGVAVMLLPTMDDQEAIAEYAGIPAWNIHCTSMFLGDTKTLEDNGITQTMINDVVHRVAAGFPMMEAGLVGITRFSSKEDNQPVVLSVSSKGVLEFRKKVEEALQVIGVEDGSEYSYNPHVTLGYIPQDEELPRLIMNWQGMDIVIDRVRVGWGGESMDYLLGQWDDNHEEKDITASSGDHAVDVGVGTRLARKKTVSRNKHPRLPLRARAMTVANHTKKRSLKMRAQSLIETKDKIAKDGDGDGFIYDGTPRQRPAPIGTPIVGQIHYAGASSYEGYGLVTDKRGNKYVVGPDDGEPGFVALVDNPKDPWGDVVVQHARTKTELFKLLDQATRNGRKPNAAPLEGGHSSNPTKIKNPTLTNDENQHLAPATRKRPPAAPGGRKPAATRKPSKKAAASKKRGGPTLAKVLATSGGNRTPEEKDGIEQIGHLDPKAGQIIQKPKDKGGTKRAKRDDPNDYHFKNGKPVQTEALRIQAHLAATGDAGKRSVELAKERGKPFRLAPARDNEHLWFPKDPNSPVAYSFRQQKYLLDENGHPVYKVVGGKKVQQFVPGEFGPRTAVYKKDFMEGNQSLKDERIINIAAHMPLLDRAILRDWKKDDTAASVALMRILGVRPNTMDEEAQARNLSKKSPLKARALRAQGIDPDQPIFGATSLRKKHVRIEGNKVILDFIGKEHVRNTHVTTDPTILAIMKDRLKKSGGPETPLFDTDANATKAYIRKALGSSNVLNKDLRSYVATEIAAREIARRPAPKDEAEFKMAQAEIAALVAQTLNNVARQSLGSYIAGPVWDKWKKGIGSGN